MTGLSHSLWAIGLMGVALPVFASETTKFEYPSEVTRTFLRGCAINPNNNQEFCSCSLRGLQQTYSFEQFTKLDAEFRETRQVPPAVQAIFSKCRQPTPSAPR